MTNDEDLNVWFVREVMPLERALSSFLHRNWRVSEDVPELRQDIYELVLTGARRTLPSNSRAYLFTVARNHLINHAKRARIVPIEAIADLDSVREDRDVGLFDAERALDARDELRRTKEGIDKLPPKCRQVIVLRKVYGMTDREAAEHLEIGIETVRRQLKLGMKALFDHMAGGSGKIVRKSYLRRDDRERDQEAAP